MTVLVIPAVIVIAAVAFAVIGIARVINEHGMHVLTWRLVSGRHYSGKHHTTATFFRDSNGKVLGVPAHHVTRRHHRAAYKNALRSLGWVCGCSLTVYGLITALWLTVSLLLASVVLASSYYVTRTVRRMRRWYVARPVTAPLAKALTTVTGLHEADIEKAIALNPNYLNIKRGQLAIISFPATFGADPAEQETVNGLIARRFPVPVDFTWKTTHPQSVTIKAAPPMPEMVTWANALPVMRELPTDEILLGFDKHNRRRTWDMASEEPMMFVSATSRRGKTTLAMSIAAQILNSGGSVTIIDPKAVGFDEFCAGHPNARVYADNTDVKSLWDGIGKFRQELTARIETYRQDRTMTFPRMTLILDEVSVFNALSIAHWEKVKPAKAKKIPPVWDDIMAIVFTGAQFNVNACIFGQRVDFRTLGGLIDGFGTRLLAGYDKQTYSRLVGILPIPLSQKPRGRFLYHNNGDEYPTWIQVPYGTDQAMRDYSMENTAQPQQRNIITSEIIREKLS